MKTFFVLFLLLAIATFAPAQRPNNNNNNSNYPNSNNGNFIQPMSDNDFSQAMRYIEDESFDDNKMLVAKRVVDGNYILSAQVKQMVKQFAFSASQMDMAKYAYPKTYDQKNYYVVNDAFSFSTSKSELSNWLKGQPINDYSNNNNYCGPRIPVAMSSQDFDNAMRQMDNESFDGDKMHIAMRVVDGNYVLSEQVRKMVKQFSFSSNQMDIAKYAYPKTFDQKNYYVVNDAFSFSTSKRELSQWLSTQPINDYTRPNNSNNNNNNWNNGGGLNDNPNNGGNNNNDGLNDNPNNGGGGRPNGNNNTNNNNNNNNNNNWNNSNNQAMSDADFNNIKTQMMAFSSDLEKVQYAKQVTDRVYWSCHQVKEMVQLMVFEDMRLDLAKYTYLKTVDTRNYYLIKELIFQPQNKTDLDNYIQNNPPRN